VARDEAEASALTLEAGIDVELPRFTCFGTGVEEALTRGLLSMKTVDAAVTRVLVEKSRLGLFENPYTNEDAITLGAPEHRLVAADAFAGVLYGDINPAAKLPVSIPRSAVAMPYFYNHKLKSAGSPIQPELGAVYPFGHGISYTTFAYSDFALRRSLVPIDGEA